MHPKFCKSSRIMREDIQKKRHESKNVTLCLIYEFKLIYKSFTIIELLVVVSIIMILVSMLLPAISKAKAIGQKAACTNNLRQLSAAIEMYKNDFNDYFPAGSGDVKSYYKVSYITKLSTYVGGPSYDDFLKNEEIRNNPDLIPKVFFCPSYNIRNMTDLGWYSYSISSLYKDIPLFKKTCYRGYADSSKTKKLSQMVLLGDGYFSKSDGSMSWGGNWFASNSPEKYSSPHLRHNNSANFIFGDGNVTSVKLYDILHQGIYVKWSSDRNEIVYGYCQCVITQNYKIIN